MATTVKWSTPGAFTTLLSTELNALAAAGVSALSPTYDNSTALDLFGDFQIDVTFGSAPTANGALQVFIIPAPDGTNFGTAQFSGAIIGGWLIASNTTQQLYTIRGIPLPPSKFKIQLQNGASVAFPATGSTVKMLPYSYQSA